MGASIYSTGLWRSARARALARDGRRCSAARLLGGSCSRLLHVHHLVPVSEGGEPYELDNLLTVCACHHPRLEALRRAVLREREPTPAPCPHSHRSLEARLLCEARRARRRVLASA